MKNYKVKQIIYQNPDNHIKILYIYKLKYFIILVLSINYFSFITCCTIIKSFIPLTMRVIRSLFIIFLSFFFNILFLNQSYYEKKFVHFNDKYKFIHADQHIKILFGKKVCFFSLELINNF